MATLTAIVPDKTERRLVEAVTTLIEESEELKEAYEKLTDSQKDNFHEHLCSTVEDFFSDLTISIEH